MRGNNVVNNTINSVEKEVWSVLNSLRKTMTISDAVLLTLLRLYQLRMEDKASTSIVKILLGRIPSHNVLVDPFRDSNTLSVFLENYTQAIDTLIETHERDGGRNFSLGGQAKELTELIAYLAGDVQSVYNPFGGFASYGVQLSPKEYCGEEINELVWAMAQIRLEAHGIKGESFKCADSIEHLEHMSKEAYDLIVSTPPFNFQVRNKTYREENIFFKEDLITQHLTSNGKLIFIGTESSTTRSFANKLVAPLVDKGYLHMLIQLPAGLLSYTNINTVLYVFGREPQQHVKMIDASNCMERVGFGHTLLDVDQVKDRINSSDANSRESVEVPISVIAKNAYSLRTAQFMYVRPSFLEEEGKYTTLGEILKEVKGQFDFADQEGRLFVNNHNELPRVYEVGELRSVSLREQKRLRKFENDVLIVRGDQFNYCKATVDSPLFVSGAVLKFYELKTNIVTAEYLLTELHQTYFKEQTEVFSKSSIIPQIPTKSLFEMRIRLLPLKDQGGYVATQYAELATQYAQKVGIELDAVRSTQFKQYHRDMRIRKHTLGQIVGVISGAITNLNECRLEHNGELNDKTVVSQWSGATVAQYFEKLAASTRKLELMLEKLTDYIEIKEENYKKVSVIQFCKNYIKLLLDTHFKVVLDEGELKEVGIGVNKGDNIYIEPDILSEIFMNIVDNAARHGFQDKSDKKHEVRISLSPTELSRQQRGISIKIANNGTPFHPSMTADKFFTWGEGTHSGIGGWDIKNRIERMGGEIELHLDAQNEYPVVLELKFEQIM